MARLAKLFLRISLLVLSVIALGGYISNRASAIGSSHYQIQEDYIGGGGGSQSSSAHYQAQDALGASVIGGGSGVTFNTQAGPITTNDPTLALSVNTATVPLGSLSTSLTKTGTATFDVLNYTSYGYLVKIIGNPPDNGVHTLTAMATQGAPTTNTEQFGINLVANTVPTSLGADPQQLPDNSFSFGAAASGYDTANQYKYVPGATIAAAPKSSGKTSYTVSYIVNVSNNTPPGSYSGRQSLVVVGTY